VSVVPATGAVWVTSSALCPSRATARPLSTPASMGSGSPPG